MCPTVLDNNKTYLSRKWIFDDKNVFIMYDLEGKLNEWIKLFKNTLKHDMFDCLKISVVISSVRVVSCSTMKYQQYKATRSTATTLCTVHVYHVNTTIFHLCISLHASNLANRCNKEWSIHIC